MPLDYTVKQALVIPDDAFTDNIVVIIAHGGRYGGRWSVKAFKDAKGPVFGEILTARDERPGMAVDTALVWLNDYAVSNGLTLAHRENLNHNFPPDQAPYFALGRFVLERPAPRKRWWRR